MAISATSASSAVQVVQHVSSATQDAQNLQRALATGNITGARAAFSQFQKELPSFGGPKGPGVGNSTPPDAGGNLKQDLVILQNALAAGDVAGAQNAFTKLKADMHEIDPPKAGVKISSSPDGSDTTPAKSSEPAEKIEIQPASSQEPTRINVFA